ncbi:MAG TPA: hypothetical protein VGD24_02400 [Gallionella sp.]
MIVTPMVDADKQTPLPLDDKIILTLTRDGERALCEPERSSRRRSWRLVLIDGHSTVEQVVKRARNLPIEMLRTSLSELVFKGLLQKTTGDKKARHRRASS